MEKTVLNWNKISNILISALIVGFLIIYGHTFLAPLVFAVFLSILILPLYNLFYRFTRTDWLSILFSFLIILSVIAGVMYFFSVQIYSVFSELSEIRETMSHGINKINYLIADKLNLSTEVVGNWINSQVDLLVELPTTYLSKGLSSSSTFLIQSVICLVYMFFLLLYKDAFRNFIISQFPINKREDTLDVLTSISKVSQQYFLGRLLVMVILAVLNSFGLWVLGIGFPILWGTLAAILTIIPYIGTTLGGTLPFIYAFATEDSLWAPVGVVIMYQIVQQLEGNIITPKIVGGTMKLNPFVSIVAMVAGGLMWGITGLIIALPVIAIIKILFDHIELMKPIGLLLDKDLAIRKDEFLNEYDQDKYRLAKYLTTKESRNKKEP